MSQMLHIFRKDLRRLWPFVLAVAALFAALAVSVGGTEEAYRSLSAFVLPRLICAILVAAIWALTAAVIHEEALPGDRQFWLTRPYSRWSLAGAKALFLTVCVLGPMLAADVVMLYLAGFGLSGNAVDLLWKAVLASVVIVAPAVCLAVITRTFAQFVLACLGGAAALMLLQPFSRMEHVSMGFGWVSLMAVAAVVAVTAPLIVGLQYWKRRTAWAAASTAVSFAVLVVCTMLPWEPVFAVQTHFSPRAIAAAEVSVKADLARGAGRDVANWGGPSVSIPIRVEHAAGLAFAPEHAAPVIVTEGEWKPLDGRQNSRVEWDGGDDLYRLVVRVRPEFLRLHGGTPLEVRADVDWTVYGNARRHRMAVRAGRAVIPELGRCFVSDGMGVVPIRVGCVAAFRTADRTRVEIVHPGGRGVRDGGLHGVVTFAPFPHDRVLMPVALAAAGFRSDSLPGEMMAESDVVFENWDRVGEVRTRVVMAGVRLKDLEVRGK